MSFGIKFKASLSINEYLETKEDLEDRISSLESELDEVEKKILMHSVSGVASAMKADDNRKPLDAVEYIYDVTTNLINSYKALSIEIYKSKLLLENWDNYEK